MFRLTQRELKRLVRIGAAKDITNSSERAAITEDYIQIGYSAGVYGCNGKLLQGKSGQLYAICQRTTAIFVF